MDSPIELSMMQVGLAAMLIVLNGLLSVVLRLGLLKTFAIAAVRTVGQLLLLGLILKWIFEANRPGLVLLILAVMTIIAGVTACQRVTGRFFGFNLDIVLSIWSSSWLITAYGLLVVVQKTETWYQPQYTIPLMGMILGNALNGVSVGMRSFVESLRTRRREVEMQLTLGATRWEAALPLLRQAVQTGLTPIINAMMVVGVVSLPGMMTGQLLAGAAPTQAIRYQIVIMFLIASATTLGTVMSILLGYRRAFSSHHQFVWKS